MYIFIGYWYRYLPGVSAVAVSASAPTFIVRRYHRGTNRRTRTPYVTVCDTTELPIGGQRTISTIRSLDVDITSYDFELRLQHIQIQMVALVILHAQLRQLGYITAYDDNVSLTQCLEILERKGLLSEQQTAWLRYFTRQANMAKHDLSRL